MNSIESNERTASGCASQLTIAGRAMGQLFSGPYHRAELQMRKTLPLLDYQPQPDEEIYQLVCSIECAE